VIQSTIQNCFLKCGHVKKNQGPDVMEVSTDVVRMTSRKMKNGFGWGQASLVWTLTPTSLDQELVSCGALCMEEICGVV
jgi:hypothetical protein